MFSLIPQDVQVLAVFVAALLAVAVGNVWYGTLERTEGTARGTGVRAIILSVVALLVFFVALAQFASYIISGTVSFFKAALILIVLGTVHHAFLVIRGEQHYRYFFMHAGYVALTIVSGLAVITYWPW